MLLTLLTNVLASPIDNKILERRLISLAEGQATWMTYDEMVEQVYKPKHHFVDVTDGYWELMTTLPPVSRTNIPFPGKPMQKELVDSMIAKIDKTYIKNFLDKFAAFNNRYYRAATGTASAQFLYDELLDIQSKLNRTDVTFTVTKFEHEWSQFSIIASLKPSVDNGIKDRVLLGAHQDSINGNSPQNGRAPGYDDDGTGTANNVAALRIMLADEKFVPGRQIDVQFYAAEEVGLRGSQRMAAKYKSDQIPVYAMLQSDMTGYPNKNPAIAIVNDNTDRELNTALAMLAKSYTKLPVVETRCGYGCSDHASWNRAGFPAAFHFEAVKANMNPNIHTPRDTFDYISLDHAVEFLKTTLAFAVELSLFEITK
jgi:leucyl aminopeptidase